jgi:hypothetical protein
VILNAGKVLHTASPDKYHAVLLKIVTFARYVGIHLAEIAQTNAAILPQC